MHAPVGMTRTELFTERVELLPTTSTDGARSRRHTPEQIAAFQKKFEIRDKDLAAQLIYALESSDPDGASKDLEQLAQSISGSGNEERKLDVLFRLLDVEHTGTITASAVDQQLRKVRSMIGDFSL